MKVRKGTYPRIVKLYDEAGHEVETRYDEGILLSFELTRAEYSQRFGEEDAERMSPEEVILRLGRKEV